jgi:sulfatase maturation enzyme AslB (radical SAM superfamily)
LPGGLVTVSLDGPEAMNDAVRGPGIFQKVKAAIAARDPGDGTTLMLQMTVTRMNAHAVAEFVEVVKDWPIDGVAFAFYIPIVDDRTGLAWEDLRERDAAVRRVIAVKQAYPDLVKAHIPVLEMMFADVCQKHTGDLNGECVNIDILPLYLGKNGAFERPSCCYGNQADCTRCGSYSLFNTVYHREILKQENYVRRLPRKAVG